MEESRLQSLTERTAALCVRSNHRDSLNTVVPMSGLMKLRRESIGFAIGSLCFAVAACPGYLGLVGEDWTNVTFFVGSIFFTLASFIQLRLTGRWQHGAWKSKQSWDDWWSAASQFIGTLFFNVTTFAALSAGLGAAAAADHVWRPDAIGSILFLVSSSLAVVATRHAGQLWDPEVRSWWSTWLNMAGSVAFVADGGGPGGSDHLAGQRVKIRQRVHLVIKQLHAHGLTI